MMLASLILVGHVFLQRRENVAAVEITGIDKCSRKPNDLHAKEVVQLSARSIQRNSTGVARSEERRACESLEILATINTPIANALSVPPSTAFASDMQSCTTSKPVGFDYMHGRYRLARSNGF